MFEREGVEGGGVDFMHYKFKRSALRLRLKVSNVFSLQGYNVCFA